MTQKDPEDEVVVALGETSEFTFSIDIEGTTSRPQSIRLIFELLDRLYGVNGVRSEDANVYKFVLPEGLTRSFQPDSVVKSSIEVCVENKHFVPVTFNTRFKQTIKVVAEAVKTPSVRQQSTPAPMTPPPVVAPLGVTAKRESFKQTAPVLKTVSEELNERQQKNLKSWYRDKA